MKYLPDQKPYTFRLDRRRVMLILSALAGYKKTLIEQRPTALRVLRAFAKALPSSLPYDVRVYAEEWAVLSPALRAANTNDHDALYHWLAKRCRFETAQMRDREQRQARKRRLESYRGVYDHERDAKAPRIPRR